MIQQRPLRFGILGAGMIAGDEDGFLPNLTTLEDEAFLTRIGAIARSGDDHALHPTRAGLLICVLYYLKAGKGLAVMDEAQFYKNKPYEVFKTYDIGDIVGVKKSSPRWTSRWSITTPIYWCTARCTRRVGIMKPARPTSRRWRRRKHASSPRWACPIRMSAADGLAAA